MTSLFGLIFSAVITFAITNADDIILLSLFFAGRNWRQICRIILGQYVGFTVLLAGSIAIGLLGLVISPRWIALLGLLPIYLGAREYHSLWKKQGAHTHSEMDIPERSVLQVAAITVANGADNLAVYGPLSSTWQL